MSDPRSLIRTLPTRNTRVRPHYRELDTDSDSDSESELDVPPRRATSRPSRSSRRVRTYRENSDSDSDEDADAAHTTTTGAAVDRVRSRPSLKLNITVPRPSSRAITKRTSSQSNQANASVLNSFKRRKLAHPRPVNPSKTEKSVDTFVPYNGVIPPWQTLPYALLVKIMKYAAYPLCSSSGSRTPSVSWLVNMSKLCKSFNDAATTALMYSPPLLPADHARSLIKLLSSDQDTLTFDYSKRVRKLDVEVRDLLIRKSGVRLGQLVRCSPLLTDLRIFHAHDSMVGKALWADPKHSRHRWSYGGLFDILDEQDTKLKAFEWNGRFEDTITCMFDAHNMSCLRELQCLSLVNFMFKDNDEEKRVIARESVVLALGQLSHLSSFTFRYGNILDDIAITSLPANLKTLEIAKCPSFTSDGLQTYLHANGSSLTGLYLSGNQVMSLGFMSDLETVCPNLEHLHIDLNYDDCTSYNDREPLYDELLPNGTPTWPRTLQSIIIEPLRSLSNEEAEDFYASLVNNAGKLKHLRTLSLKTFLQDAGWRDRARLRSKWTPLFDKVFLANKTYIPKQVKVIVPAGKMPKKSPRKSARLIELGESSVTESADDSDSMIPEPLVAPLQRQNACNLVEFELSDQRPAKEQYTEQDFLDDELAGDGEYNG